MSTPNDSIKTLKMARFTPDADGFAADPLVATDGEGGVFDARAEMSPDGLAITVYASADRTRIHTLFCWRGFAAMSVAMMLKQKFSFDELRAHAPESITTFSEAEQSAHQNGYCVSGCACPGGARQAHPSTLPVATDGELAKVGENAERPACLVARAVALNVEFEVALGDKDGTRDIYVISFPPACRGGREHMASGVPDGDVPAALSRLLDEAAAAVKGGS